MPKNTRDRREMTQKEIAAQEEKFRSFFTTTAVDIPAEMTRRDDEEPEKPKKGFRLFHRGREKQAEEPDECGLKIPAGELLRDDDAQPEEAGLELVLDPTREPEPQPVPPGPAEPQPVQTPPEPEAAQPGPLPAEEPKPEKKTASRQEKKPKTKPRDPKNAPEVLLPQEEKEQQEMAQLKAMIGLGSAKKTAGPAKAEEKPKAEPLPAAVFAATQETAAEPEKTAPEQPSIFAMFGTPEDEKTPAAPQTPAKQDRKEDTMSLPLMPLDEETAETPLQTPPAEGPCEEETPGLTTEAEDALPPQAETEEQPLPPENTADRLRRMSAELTLRCVLGGILAAVLLHFGMVSDGLLPAISALDPDAAPAAFYAANLLLFAASLCVGYPVVRDGLPGLWGKPSAETMPALAAAAALLQAVTAMLNAVSYRSMHGISLLTGVAALGLFLALLGSRVMLAAVKSGYDLATGDGKWQEAYRARNKDLLRALARGMEQKDPWVLLSRPLQSTDGFVEQSLGERASERRARKMSRILLGIAVLSGALFLLAGAGWNKAVAAMAAVLCMGAPLSSTLVAGISALRLQRAAAAVGAVVPGWQAIEQLGGIDTLQVDADDLFTADSVALEDLRIFKGGRIDRAILYAASVLNNSCETLKGIFQQIVADRTEILLPVKDLEEHSGLGYSAWCDNNRILIGSRAYLEQEGVPLPDTDYEREHSRNGELQILYLAVSGAVHAMFVLRYVGGRNTAHSLAVLQKENIRLLVTCRDPSLTAEHISNAYHLPEGMVTLLDPEQRSAIATAPADPGEICCMIHAGTFASLTGGLQAADRAQNAETSATMVQLVSVWFSIVIAVLLNRAGTIWELSVATVLMYQAAWSALSIAVCALKQHN